LPSINKPKALVYPQESRGVGIGSSSRGRNAVRHGTRILQVIGAATAFPANELLDFLASNILFEFIAGDEDSAPVLYRCTPVSPTNLQLSFESLQSQDWVHDTAMRREETFLDNMDTDRKPATFLPTTTATEITTTTRSICCLVTTIYIRLSRVSTTYTYEDIYTRVGRYLPQRRIKGGTQVLESEKGATDI
jgi:hypothetical protein